MIIVTNRQIASAFRDVKPVLKKYGGYKFICNNLRNNAFERGYGFGFGTIAETAAKIVEKRLAGQSTLENWLIDQGYKYYLHPERDVAEDMYNTRQAWLDSLIVEFDKPGHYKEKR